MSWSLTASGHAASKEDEAKLLANLREEFCGDWAGTYSASVSSQFHGTVNLATKAEDEPSA